MKLHNRSDRKGKLKELHSNVADSMHLPILVSHSENELITY